MGTQEPLYDEETQQEVYESVKPPHLPVSVVLEGPSRVQTLPAIRTVMKRYSSGSLPSVSGGGDPLLVFGRDYRRQRVLIKCGGASVNFNIANSREAARGNGEHWLVNSSDPILELRGIDELWVLEVTGPSSGQFIAEYWTE